MACLRARQHCAGEHRPTASVRDAQRGSIVAFPQRPKPPPSPAAAPARAAKTEIRKSRCSCAPTRSTTTTPTSASRRSATSRSTISGSTLEADRVIYDQKTKRLHAEGNVRLSEADGKVTYGEIIDLSDDFRDGFVDSLRLEGPEQTRFAATRAERTSGNFTVFQNGVYTACEPCKDDPTKPPKWQVKAARIIHDQGEKMMYFEDARLEFFGVPLACMPYFSTPDPTRQAQERLPRPDRITRARSTASRVTTPYYFALAPDYDATITPMITTKQGPLLQGEWRQRLVNGSYTIRATGIFQLDKQAFLDTAIRPAIRDFRGNVESSGQFRLTRQMGLRLGRHADHGQAYFQDYGLYRRASRPTNLLATTPDYVVVAGLPAGPRRPQLLRYARDVFLRLLQRRTASAKFRSSIR